MDQNNLQPGINVSSTISLGVFHGFAQLPTTRMLPMKKPTTHVTTLHPGRGARATVTSIPNTTRKPNLTKIMKNKRKRQRKKLKRAALLAAPSLLAMEYNSQSAQKGVALKQYSFSGYQPPMGVQVAPPRSLSIPATFDPAFGSFLQCGNETLANRAQQNTIQSPQSCSTTQLSPVTPPISPPKAQFYGKRRHYNYGTSSQYVQKRLKLTQAEPAHHNLPMRQDLKVAITSTNQLLTPEQTHRIMQQLKMKILKMALNQSVNTPNGPRLKGKPIQCHGAIKLWCMDRETVEWLEQSIDDISEEIGLKLILISQSELECSIRGGIVLPGVWEDPNVVWCTLKCQNKWALVDRWLIQTLEPQPAKDCTFVVFSIPEEVKPILLKHQRCLAFMIGAVYITFRGVGRKFYRRLPKKSQHEFTAVPTSNELRAQTIAINRYSQYPNGVSFPYPSFLTTAEDTQYSSVEECDSLQDSCSYKEEEYDDVYCGEEYDNNGTEEDEYWEE